MSPQLSEEGRVLLHSMQQASEALRTAHSDYLRALDLASESDARPDGMLFMKQEGRKYAAAVHRYSDAVMAWLTFIEVGRWRGPLNP